MLLSPPSVCKGITFMGPPSAMFLHLYGQILLPRYLMNGLSNIDEICNDYLLSCTDNLIRFWRSKVKAQWAVKIKACEHHMNFLSNLDETYWE